MLKRFIKDEIYGKDFTVYALVSDRDVATVNAYYHGALLDIIRGSSAFVARVERNGQSSTIMVLCPGYGETDIVHEIIHHATCTFKEIGIVIEHGQDEPFAYYVEYILRKCLKAMAKRKVKLKTGTRSKNTSKRST